jgi:alpha,alpha-trehalase
MQTEGPVFEAVQSRRLFADSKTFVDAVPSVSADELRRAFADLAPGYSDDDLRALVHRCFRLPERAKTTPLKAPNAAEYVTRTWSRLTKTATTVPPGSSMLPLPNPFLVPGGRFDECFYWDSYFTALGLIGHGGDQVAEQIADNLVHLQSTVGLIPNGSRTYLATRSQPPVLALLVARLPDPTKYLDALLREHTFWMQPERVIHVDGAPLAHYWDSQNTPRPESYAEDVHTNGGIAAPCDRFRHLRAAAESGWDFSSRWLDDPDDLATIRCADVLPVDLNTLLVNLEQTISALRDRVKQHKQAATFRQASLARAEVIKKRFFDPSAGWFCDLESSSLERRPQLSAAGVLPLTSSIATDQQAGAVRQTLMQRFLASGGVRTTLVNTEQQWDGRNGWAPLQWWAIEAMERHGFDDEAAEIAQRWIRTCERGFATDGALLEKYNVEDPSARAGGGEYEIQEGFGWTNGVYVALKAKYGSS